MIGVGALLGLCALTAACSTFYWAKPHASGEEFRANERVCLREATKHDYRQCMESAGWVRYKSSGLPPTDRYEGYPDEHGWAFRP